MEIAVANNAAANSMNIFPAARQTINNLAANTALGVAAGTVGYFVSFLEGLGVTAVRRLLRDGNVERRIPRRSTSC
jgi:hypothetical protein